MRISRLDLLRYGRFTDTSLELPLKVPDIHIIFGPNEAGKSTALSAMADFLFGIPHNSPLNFLHDYGSMRLGAVLQSEGKRLEACRRKGNKDTLLTPEDVPLPAGDSAMAEFLPGADRTFFLRMFSLDHERLRQGGREILEAKDEVGQMLFSAGSGIADLRSRLKALEEEADTLWASRKSARRKYYQAEERLKEAESSLREHTVTADKWQKLRQAYEDARHAYAEIELEIGHKTTELNRLGRIRRVYRYVRRRSELETAIADLGKVIPLPEDGRKKLEEAENAHEQATIRYETLTEQLNTARKGLESLIFDDALLQREVDIRQLNERRIQVRAGKADLPELQAELAAAEGAFRHLAAELRWETGDIDKLSARMPGRSETTDVRTLLGSRGELLSDMKAAEAGLNEAEERLSEITERIKNMGAPRDVSRLAAVIKVTSENADIESRITVAEGQIEETRAHIKRLLGSLRPGVSSEDVLSSLSVPPRDTVQTHRDACRDLDQRLKVCRERLRDVEQNLGSQEKAAKRITSEEHAVTPDELARTREYRDKGWSIIRKQYIEGSSMPEEDMQSFIGMDGNLAGAYEKAIRQADETADRRFDKAEAAARLVVISRQIGEQEDLIEKHKKEEAALGEEGRMLEAAWQTMWEEAPFSPLSPDAMLEWLTVRAEILSLVERRAAAQRQFASLRLKESEAANAIVAELKAVGADSESLAGRPLRIVLEAATDVQRTHEHDAEVRGQLEEDLRKGRRAAELRRKGLEEARLAWSEWESQWEDALSSLGLDGQGSPEAVAARLNAIDEMREIAVRINELRNERIGKIESYVAAFNQDVAEMASAVATDLAGAEPEATVLELESRLKRTERIQELRKEKDEKISSLEREIGEYEGSLREAEDIIRHLQDSAGVENIDDLKRAIEKSERLSTLEGDLSAVTQTIIEAGDGLSFAQLQEECEGVDIDKIVAAVESVEDELSLLRGRLMETQGVLTTARHAFEAVGGDDAAAKAAADRESALTEIREVAEQYVRVRSAVLLLQWAIERYRREKQAPLLMRTGQLFKILTCGSFSDLRPDFDEQDNIYLAGLRPAGEIVGVEGMSTGTADQLYLALRVASVEDYLDRASPLPFFADDLFINFDDDRAAAGFEVLSRLAQKTQVLFFTHHQHLVDVARKVLGPSLSVISLLPTSA